jgi:uncharacterized protein YbgA (DUF1722 family)
MQRFPLLPVEEEGRLHDMALRENFIERVFAYYRWRSFVASHPTPRDLVRFHTQHKMALLAHSRPHYQALGRLVAQAGSQPFARLLEAYGEELMIGLKVKSTKKKHANVLSHLQGYLKRRIDAADKAELAQCIDDVIPLESESPDALKRYVKSEMVRWGKVVTQAGLAGSR